VGGGHLPTIFRAFLGHKIMAIKAKIDGKIARIGELKQSAGGKDYYSFTASVWDNKENKAEYVQGIAFGEVASSIALLEKGAEITILGELRLVSYIAKDGSNKQALNLTVDRAFWL
jgi:single-stranded DNA-binding protein